jgi:hypothetical protein
MQPMALQAPSASMTSANLSNSNTQQKRKVQNILLVGRKRSRQSYRDEIASAVTGIAKSLDARGKSWSERSSELLWENYGDRISVQDGIKAVALFQQEAVAMPFYYMLETAKENWLVLENLLAESSHSRTVTADDSEQQILLSSNSRSSGEPATGDTAAKWEIPVEEWEVSD